MISPRYQVDLVFRDGVNREALRTDDVEEARAKARELARTHKGAGVFIGVTDLEVVDLGNPGSVEWDAETSIGELLAARDRYRGVVESVANMGYDNAGNPRAIPFPWGDLIADACEVLGRVWPDGDPLTGCGTALEPQERLWNPEGSGG